MDSNGTRFLLLADAEGFATTTPGAVPDAPGIHPVPGDNAGIGWDPGRAALVLSQRQRLRLPADDAARAATAWGLAKPLIQDGFGQLGRLSPDRARLEVAAAWPTDPDDPAAWSPVLASAQVGDDGLPLAAAGSAEAAALDPVDAPAGTRFTDIHIGGDAALGEGLVALAYSDGLTDHGLLVVHLRQRWQVRVCLAQTPTALCGACVAAGAAGCRAGVRLASPPLRVWVAGDRVWVASASALILCAGAPLPQPWRPAADQFAPLDPNPNRLRPLWQTQIPAHDGLLGLCADAEGLYLLVRRNDPDGGRPGQVILRRRLDDPAEAPFDAYPVDPSVPFATDIAAIGDARLALLAPVAKPTDPAEVPASDCPVVTLIPAQGARPARAALVQERYPQRGQRSVRFVRTHSGETRYLGTDGPQPLYPLPQARYPDLARATLRQPLDAGEPGTLWHRIYLDACIPQGCAIAIDARVSESETDRRTAGWDPQPAPLWTPNPSELPWDAGRFTPIPGRQGCFEILLQRPNGAVRELRGRYLELRLTLSGDGRHSPRVRALRVSFPRHSWQSAYLPQHFHQQGLPPAFTPDLVSSPQPANGADVRERMLAALEGMLTPLEDRIAAAEILLDPAAAPAGRLPTLAAMLGTRVPEDWPEPRRRRWLRNAGRLQARRGTLAGLALALDIATDGGVGLGQVVPVENFRLRRTLATILGLDLSDEGHPLTLGTGQSGNSIVGESLILGDEDSQEFLALFAPELAETRAETGVVASFFDRYARRLTVILHGEARTRRRAVEQTLADQVPAMVQWVVRESDHPFVLGLSPLLGIDSFLETEPPAPRVVLDLSPLGRGALLRNPVALSPQHALAGASTHLGDRS